MSHQIGTPSYGSNKKKNFKLKDGSNVYRILPPFASLASDGRWAVYESVHWGYKGSKGARPFKCIEIRGKDKILKRECPECTLIAKTQKDYEDKFNLLTKGVDVNGQKVNPAQLPGGKLMTKTEAENHLKFIADFLYAHNRDRKWYLNVLNRQNEIGRLAIPHKMYSALQAVIAGPNGLFTKKGIDPIRVDGGVWFNFERTGTGRETNHRVLVEMKTVTRDGETFETIEKAPLTEDVLKRMQSESSDLSKMSRELTAEEIQRLVDHSGDPEVVDSIFTSPESAVAKKDEAADDEPSAEELESAVVALTSAPAVTPVDSQAANVAPAATTPDAAAQIAALQAQLAALQTTPAPKPVEPQKTKAAVTATPGSSVSTMSNSDFLANFAAGKL